MKNFSKRLSCFIFGLVALAIGGAGISNTITVNVEDTKSSMQTAYEAAAALNSGKYTSTSYTFTGVVVGTFGNSYIVQDDEYGMYVYGGKNTPPTGLAVGKTVSVKSILQKYNGIIETKDAPTATITGDGVLPEAITVSSSDQLAALNQNILVNIEVIMPTEIGKWSSYNKLLQTTTFDGADFTVTFDKFAYNETAGNVLSRSGGKKVLISNAITTAYSTKGDMTTSQIMVTQETTLTITSEKEAAEYASTFMSKTDTIYGNGVSEKTGADLESLKTAWEELSKSYTALSDDAKANLKAATANNGGTDVEKAVARYDHIIKRYSFNNFMDRSITSNISYNVLNINDTNNMIPLIIIVSLISITLVGSLIIIRKRKVN